MNATVIRRSPASFCARARPAATGTMLPWMPLLKKPSEHRCWLPPRPPHTPDARPMISAASPSTSSVRARKWPWQRWLLKTRSPSSSASATAMPVHSWPMQVCTVPNNRPSENSASSRCSTARIRRPRAYKRSATGLSTSRMLSVDITLRTREVLHVRVERADRNSRHTGVQAIGLVLSAVEQRLSAEHGVIGQHGAPENRARRSHETVLADRYGFCILPADHEVDAVGEYLRAKSRHRREAADRHALRAIDDVAVRDRGMRVEHELRVAIR